MSPAVVPKPVPVIVICYLITGEADVGDIEDTVGTPVAVYVKSDEVVSEDLEL